MFGTLPIPDWSVAIDITLGWSFLSSDESNVMLIDPKGITAVYRMGLVSSDALCIPAVRACLRLRMENSSWVVNLENFKQLPSSTVIQNARISHLKEILHLSKDHKSIIWGNNIESDGGPAFVFRRINIDEIKVED